MSFQFSIFLKSQNLAELLLLTAGQQRELMVWALPAATVAFRVPVFNTQSKYKTMPVVLPAARLKVSEEWNQIAKKGNALKRKNAGK